MGISNIITFDAHDPRVVNAIPLHGFDNCTPPYQFIKAIFDKEPDLQIDSEHVMVISPDEGGMNPIVEHQFLGNNVEGKDVFVVDDIISSGESIIQTLLEEYNVNTEGLSGDMPLFFFVLFKDYARDFRYSSTLRYFTPSDSVASPR